MDEGSTPSISTKHKISLNFNYNLYGNAISHIKSNTKLRHIDINNRLKQVPHRLRILQTYFLGDSIPARLDDVLRRIAFKLKIKDEEHLTNVLNSLLIEKG